MENHENLETPRIYADLEAGAGELSKQFEEYEKRHPDEHCLVSVAGPPGGGKSTFSGMIADENTLTLSLDRYYLGAEAQQREQGIVNFSIPEALDQKRIAEDLEKLLAAKFDEQVAVPIYDMKKSQRIGEERVSSKRRIVVEGVYALRVTQNSPFRIYIDVPDDLLLERRLERDVTERGVPEEIVKDRFEKNVRPALGEFVKPQKELANVIVENGKERLQ